MHFQHSPEIWRDFPQLVAGVLLADRITTDASVAGPVAELCAVAAGRRATASRSSPGSRRPWASAR